jgi:hypothetical protein
VTALVAREEQWGDILHDVTSNKSQRITNTRGRYDLVNMGFMM